MNFNPAVRNPANPHFVGAFHDALGRHPETMKTIDLRLRLDYEHEHDHGHEFNPQSAIRNPQFS